MRAILAAIPRACVCSAPGLAIILSIATVGAAMGLTEAMRPVPIAKTQDRIASPEMSPIAVRYTALDPWVVGLPKPLEPVAVLYVRDDPWIVKEVKTISIPKPEAKPTKKKHKRSSVDDIIKSAPRSALLAYAKAAIGKRGPQLGLPSSLWCMDFVNAILRRVGLPTTGSRMARSPVTSRNFVRVAKPVPGDLVIISRGRSAVYGHVAFFNGRCGKGGIRMLGGNQAGGRVTDQCVHGRSIVAFVRPKAIANDNVQVADSDPPRVKPVKVKKRVVKQYRKPVVRQAAVEKPMWGRQHDV